MQTTSLTDGADTPNGVVTPLRREAELLDNLHPVVVPPFFLEPAVRDDERRHLPLYSNLRPVEGRPLNTFVGSQACPLGHDYLGVLKHGIDSDGEVGERGPKFSDAPLERVPVGDCIAMDTRFVRQKVLGDRVDIRELPVLQAQAVTHELFVFGLREFGHNVLSRLTVRVGPSSSRVPPLRPRESLVSVEDGDW